MIVLVIRKLTEPVEIGGYELPAGARVTPCIHLVHRDPEIYPEPDRFLPERFLDNPPGTYTWIPFGGGVRRCLGAAFAQFEMAVVLRELVKRHQIRPGRPRVRAPLPPRHHRDPAARRRGRSRLDAGGSQDGARAACRRLGRPGSGLGAAFDADVRWTGLVP